MAVASDEHFERLWGFPHGYTFEKAAQLFHLDYRFADSEEAFAECLDAAMREKKACILEVATLRTANAALHKHLREVCTRCLHDTV
jgi:2-succinyl-5-enolpyruvyl-6-hydroxy-3-cyclohexene-1-carboxylate synthase